MTRTHSPGFSPLLTDIFRTGDSSEATTTATPDVRAPGDSISSEPRELQSVVEAAEKAAAAGDYVSAEQHLREAVLLQEARLGPLLPDLANTLNNLGVVYELTDKPAEAELCYRRAYTIAITVLEPDHPFVATSRKNLTDFCETHGKSIELPTPFGEVSAEQEPTTGFHDESTDRRWYSHLHPLAVAAFSHPRAIGAVSMCGFVITFLALRGGFDSNLRGTTPMRNAPTPIEQPTALQHGSARHILAKKSATGNESRIGVSDNRIPLASALPEPTVAEAQLCRELSTAEAGSPNGDWHCGRADLPVNSGSLFFYTRLKSSGDTTIQHRWYRGENLHHVVELQVRANTTRGYRTYSRTAVDSLKGADWRVELRTNDGILLHEEHFSVH